MTCGLAPPTAGDLLTLRVCWGACSATVQAIQKIVSQRAELGTVDLPRTLHLGPDHVHVDLDIRSSPEAIAAQLAETVKWLEGAVYGQHPEVLRGSIRLL